MSGTIWLWGQADRQRGAGWSSAHLFPRDYQTGLDKGHAAICGYDPTRNLPAGGGVVFQAEADAAARCTRCETHWPAVAGHVYYPLGEHPADLARAGR